MSRVAPSSLLLPSGFLVYCYCWYHCCHWHHHWVSWNSGASTVFRISWVQSPTSTTRSPVTGVTPGHTPGVTRVESCCCCQDPHSLWCWSLGARVMCAFCRLISSLLGLEAQLLQPGAMFNVHWELAPLYFPVHSPSDEQVCGLCSTLVCWTKLFLFHWL